MKSKVMPKNIDEQIAEKFNEQSDLFPTEIADHLIEVKKVKELLGKVKGKRILDIGCGKGRFVAALEDAGAAAVGIEPARKLLEAGKKLSPGLELIEGFATKLPFKDNSFDGAICVEVLEHIPDYKKAIAEAHRILKPGGRYIIIDKNLNGLSERLPLPCAWEKFFMERMNKWMYPKDFPFREIWFRPKSLAQELRDKGFKNVRVDYFDIHKRPWHLIKKFSYFGCWYGEKE